MKKRKMLVTGSLVTTILLAGASTGFAQTVSGTLSRNKKAPAGNSRSVGGIMQLEAAALGVDIPTLKQDLQEKKRISEIVAAQGLTLGQYHQNLIDQLEMFLQKGGLSTGQVTRINQLIKKLKS